MHIQRFQVEQLKIEVYPDRAAAGNAAAAAAGECLRKLAAERGRFAVVFATGASQLEMLRALTATPDLPWAQVEGFHLDEYVGIDENHPASFRRYLRENLTGRVRLGAFHEVNGSGADSEAVCRAYAERLRAAAPPLCLLGIGENGHLAFNEPSEANFDDPQDVKVVTLDATCRQQQTAEGWFKSIVEVPANAITVTIPAILRIPRLILSVPGQRKAEIMLRVLTEPLSPHCPATILRTHPNATVYLDAESAVLIKDRFSAT